MSIHGDFASRLAAGEPLFSAWVGSREPAVAAVLAREAFDLVTLDMQHGAVDIDAAIRGIQLVAGAGKPAVVRIPVGDFQATSRMLDAGAAAVIAPMVNSAADARAFAAFAKFPPLGERSWGPHAALALSGLAPKDYLARANGLTGAVAMIETRAALDALDDILAVEGIDAVFIGPSDLSIALSGGRELEPESAAVDEAIDHVLARAKAAGKAVWAYAGSPERAAAFARKGIVVSAIGSDTVFLRQGAQAALAAVGR
ncbi:MULTISPECIES: HpcH/HpaI aldolase/citrate lyase family protein [Chelatococcus]|uniref:4-hydroxy-2-oxoheptanedioate aldolase n=1 Tax=Chelatococcus caeni TaxID=1348468 RepID=A0A840C8S1_9HYPH|nr:MULTISPECIES: aldolase/citrate lyase family protein [Chelatococcus]ALA19684.1 hydroxyacid aldolase [Chelatococcus sp. CO-6]MBB4019988.1 4-hydroxy-2-oxoheptanedioate aldolase [Chelatococcus caeni]